MKCYDFFIYYLIIFNNIKKERERQECLKYFKYTRKSFNFSFWRCTNPLIERNNRVRCYCFGKVEVVNFHLKNTHA
jgi:hypothetical protein